MRHFYEIFQKGRIVSKRCEEKHNFIQKKKMVITITKKTNERKNMRGCIMGNLRAYKFLYHIVFHYEQFLLANKNCSHLLF